MQAHARLKAGATYAKIRFSHRLRSPKFLAIESLEKRLVGRTFRSDKKVSLTKAFRPCGQGLKLRPTNRLMFDFNCRSPHGTIAHCSSSSGFTGIAAETAHHFENRAANR